MKIILVNDSVQHNFQKLSQTVVKSKTLDAD